MGLACVHQWQWLDRAPLAIHTWPGEPFALVFHPATGDTHLVDLLSAEVLRLLESGPLPEDQLWHQLLTQTGFSPEELPSSRFQSILTQLERLNLIERVAA